MPSLTVGNRLPTGSAEAEASKRSALARCLKHSVAAIPQELGDGHSDQHIAVQDENGLGRHAKALSAASGVLM